jgi:hypothetical protein
MYSAPCACEAKNRITAKKKVAQEATKQTMTFGPPAGLGPPTLVILVLSQ